MTDTKCPNCHKEINKRWDAHIEAIGRPYLFPCPHCGAALQASFADNYDICVELEQPSRMPTGSELHRRKYERGDN